MHWLFTVVVLLAFVLNGSNSYAAARSSNAEKINVIVVMDSGLFAKGKKKEADALITELNGNYVTGAVLIINSKLETPESLANKMIDFYLSLDESSPLLFVSLSAWDMAQKGIRLKNGALTGWDVDDLLVGSRSLGIVDSCPSLPNRQSALITHCALKSKSSLVSVLTGALSDYFAENAIYLDAWDVLSALDDPSLGTVDVPDAYPYEFRIWKRATPMLNVSIRSLSEEELVPFLVAAGDYGRRLNNGQYTELLELVLDNTGSIDVQDATIRLLARDRKYSSLEQIVADSRSNYARSLAVGALVDAGRGKKVAAIIEHGIGQEGLPRLFALANVSTLVNEFPAENEDEYEEIANTLVPQIRQLLNPELSQQEFRLALEALAKISSAAVLIDVVDEYPARQVEILSTLANVPYDSNPRLEQLVFDSLASGDAALIIEASQVIVNQPAYVSGPGAQDFAAKVLMNNVFNRDDRVAAATLRALGGVALSKDDRYLLSDIIQLNLYRPGVQMSIVEYIGEFGLVTDAAALLPLLEIRDTSLRIAVLAAFDQLRERFPEQMATIAETDKLFIEGFAKFYVANLIENAPHNENHDQGLYLVVKDRLGSFPKRAFDEVVYDRLFEETMASGQRGLRVDLVDILANVSTPRALKGLLQLLQIDPESDPELTQYTLAAIAASDDVDVDDELYDHAMSVLTAYNFPPYEELSINASFRMTVLSGRCRDLEELHDHKSTTVGNFIDRVELAKCHFETGDRALALEELAELEHVLRTDYRRDVDAYASGMMRLHRMRTWILNRSDLRDQARIEMWKYLALDHNFPNNSLSTRERRTALQFLADAIGDNPPLLDAVDRRASALEREAEFDATAEWRN